MKVVVAEDTGFCYGVKRAIDLVTKRLKEQGKLYCLGPLIHNQTVIGELEKKGLRIVNKLSQIKGEFVIRSHGLHPALIKEAKKRNFKIIDATCPFVKMVQRKVKYLVRNGYEVIIVGNPKHPEVKALSGFAGDEAIIMKQNSKLKTQNSKSRKIGVVSQTTIKSKDYRRAVVELYKKIEPEEFLSFDTVCQITKKRQKEVSVLSRKVDSFLVLGGKESSNTRTLYEMCRERRPAFLVETPSQVRKKWFLGMESVGILSGTSTPDRVVKEAAERIRRLK